MQMRRHLHIDSKRAMNLSQLHIPPIFFAAPKLLPHATQQTGIAHAATLAMTLCVPKGILGNYFLDNWNGGILQQTGRVNWRKAHGGLL